MRARACLNLFVLLVLPGCPLFPGAGNNGESEINEEYLTQQWVHSYEEDPQGSTVNVYRPHDYKMFPPSRFRMQYIFEEGGGCQWYYLAPDDGHHFRPGTWQLMEENVLHIEQGEETVRYRVVELTEKLLQIKRLDADVK